jgi:hypothetical protein
MAKSSVYSALNVVAVLDGLNVVGLWDGDDAIVVTPGADIGVGLVGADGSSIFSQSADRSARISQKLQHTSATHRQLLQKEAAQRSGIIRGFPVSIKELGSGEGGTTDQAFIQAAPADSKGKAATMREWVIWSGDWTREITNP